MSRPQESSYVLATYKKLEARKNIPFDTTARNKQHVRVVQGSMATCYIHIIIILTPQFTFNSNFLWSKRNLYIKHFDTSDTDLSFILGSNN